MFHLKMARKGPKHVVNKENNNINKFSVAIAGICLKDIKNISLLTWLPKTLICI
jgi:hypothetical protein